MTKTILITGASSGIGEACAKHAVKAGHKVVLAARSKDKLQSLVDELGDDNAIGVECDVTDVDSQTSLFAKAEEKFGSIDVVYANAGMGATGSGTAEGDLDNFKDMIMVNIFAVTVTAKLAAKYLKKTKGQFVVTGSQAGHFPLQGSVYGATKWFIRGYAQNLAKEFADYGVKVTSIDPGMVDTPFFDEGKPDALTPDDIARGFMYAIEQPEKTRVACVQIYPMM